jgi:glutathione S-transferase
MSQFTLIIGNKNYSSWSLRPWMLMRHLQLPFDELLIPLFQPDMRSRIAQHSPTGRVPVLKHGNLTVWESLAIGE